MNPLRSILTASIALAVLSHTSLRAETFPIFEDAAGSPITNVITKAAGAAKTLAVSAKSTAFINFAVGSGQGDPTFNIDPATVTSARLIIFLPKGSKTGTLSIKNLTSAFTETITTASIPAPTLGATIDTIDLATIPLNSDYYTSDITAQVKAWLTTPASEFGVAITSDGTATAILASKEGAGSGHPAVIEVEVNRGGGTVSGTTAAFTGNVGIGTSSAQSRLDVRGGGASGGTPTMIIAGAGGTLTQVINSTNGNNLWDIIASTDNYAISRSGTDFPFVINLATGNVGIGTTAPTQGKLVVSGNVVNLPVNSAITGLAFNGQFATGAPVAENVSIFATHSVWTNQNLIASSDARIKTIQGRSDRAADLEKLLGIEITDYLYKDAANQGSRPQKKVIAQQVERVFPQAVSLHTDVVPDIYTSAPEQDGWVTLATDLKVGDRVRLLTKTEQGIHEVLEVKDGAFRTAFQPAGDEVFVYGREVKDFRTVDYDAIAMLNVSATQELAKQLAAKDAEIATLKTAHLALAEKLAGLDRQLAVRKTDRKDRRARTVNASLVAQ